MLSKLPTPTIFAHRGASAYTPENTLASFRLALQQRADAVELDAKLTADGEVVVIHDQTVDRTTSGSGQVKELTLTQIRELDAGSHFDAAFHRELVPTLEEVFEIIGQATYINVELTNYASITDDLPEKVAALVKRHNMERRLLFSSFNPVALVRIRRQLPMTPIGLLAVSGRKGTPFLGWPGRLLSYDSLHPEFTDVNPGLVRNVHRRGNKLFTYTVNLETDMRRLFEMGVDGIFTDNPALAWEVRDRL